MRSQGVRFLSFVEPEEILVSLPGVERRVMPLCAGGFRAAHTRFDLGDITFEVGECVPAMAMGTFGPATAAIQLPFEGLEALLVNGHQAFPRAVGLYGPGSEFERSGKQPTRHTALLLQAKAAEMLLAPPRGSPLLHPGKQALIQAQSQAWANAVDLARAAAKTATANAGIFDLAEARRSLHSALLVAMHTLVTGEDGEPTSLRNSPARRRIVRTADEYLRVNPARPIYTEDLCTAIGVSATRMADAFRVTFGVSPHRFLKLRRLAMVRVRLHSGNPDDKTVVKTTALSHGFWHLGQFAHDYHALYGETPSATLTRSHRR